MVIVKTRGIDANERGIIFKTAIDRSDERITKTAMLEGLRQNTGTAKLANMAIERRLTNDSTIEALDERIRIVEHALKQARDVLSLCVQREFKKKLNGNGSNRHLMVREFIDVLDIHKEKMKTILSNQEGNLIKTLLFFDEQDRTHIEIIEIGKKYREEIKPQDSLSSVLGATFEHTESMINDMYFAVESDTMTYFTIKDTLAKYEKKLAEKSAKRLELDQTLRQRVSEAEEFAQSESIFAARAKILGIEKRLASLKASRDRMGKDAHAIITPLGNAAGKYDYKTGVKISGHHQKGLLDFVSDITLIPGSEELFFRKILDLFVMVEKGATNLNLAQGIKLKDANELQRVRNSINILLGEGKTEEERKSNTARRDEVLRSISHMKKMDVRKAVLEEMLDRAKREELLSESDARKARSDAGAIGTEIGAVDKAILSIQTELRRYMKESFGVDISITDIQLLAS